jgi:hypothetical protein
VLRRGQRDACEREPEDGEEDTERAPLGKASHTRIVVVGPGRLIPESRPWTREYNPGREGV